MGHAEGWAQPVYVPVCYTTGPMWCLAALKSESGEQRLVEALIQEALSGRWCAWSCYRDLKSKRGSTRPLTDCAVSDMNTDVAKALRWDGNVVLLSM